MKRTIIFATLLMLVLSSALAAQSTMRRTYRDLDVDVWTDRDDGSNYYEGDDITIYFRASQDAYVTIYDLDTRGNVNLIFPPEPGVNNYVQAGEIYMIPETSDDYTLTLEGPPGNEYIQAVASLDYFPVPDWQGPVSVYSKDWGIKYNGENDDFIAMVNDKYFSGANYAYDNVSFYVAPKYYYKPERTDCSGDCGQVYVDYPDGCEVYVDGVFYGYAPLWMPSIYLGRHRMTIYWSSTVVYNDWIFVEVHDPFFIYTRPWFVYNYCWDHWYRNYGWDSYYHGPSRYKYKHDDFYNASKPKIRRGYEVVNNDHARYSKSKTYVTDKVERINKYKETHGFDAKTKTFTASKYRQPDEFGTKKYYNADSYNKKGSDNRGTLGKRDSGDKYYHNDNANKKEDSGRTYDGRKGSSGSEKKGSGGDVGKPSKPSGGDSKKSGGDAPQVKPKSEGKSTPSAPPAKERSGSSGGDKPSSGGKKH